jgi:hypothetical protein
MNEFERKKRIENEVVYLLPYAESAGLATYLKKKDGLVTEDDFMSWYHDNGPIGVGLVDVAKGVSTILKTLKENDLITWDDGTINDKGFLGLYESEVGIISA